MIYGLLVLFLALQAADAATTIYGVRNGLKEANAIMRKVHGALGLYGGLFLMKLPISALIAYIVVTGQVGVYFMLWLVIPFAGLLANNLYWIRKARG